jgi:hypothetical protein
VKAAAAQEMAQPVRAAGQEALTVGLFRRADSVGAPWGDRRMFCRGYLLACGCDEAHLGRRGHVGLRVASEWGCIVTSVAVLCLYSWTPPFFPPVSASQGCCDALCPLRGRWAAQRSLSDRVARRRYAPSASPPSDTPVLLAARVHCSLSTLSARAPPRESRRSGPVCRLQMQTAPQWRARAWLISLEAPGGGFGESNV